jgi:phosphohistidine swiveling domain-containing protein
VEQNIRRKPLGALKVQAFRATLAYVLKFQQYRDDERHFIDRSTYSIRRAFLEVNRRLLIRGLVDTDRDFWFLTYGELFDVLSGEANMTLAKAKIAGRMRNFDRFRVKEWSPPKFLTADRGISFDPAPSNTDDDAVLQGVPTSRGQVTATARIVTDLAQIERVNAGEILIANSTDPGWTPVFAVISGVIVETGGMLSHSSCLAREYGFPAVQLEGALRSIPDGATIELDGDSGRVRITAPAPTPV